MGKKKALTLKEPGLAQGVWEAVKPWGEGEMGLVDVASAQRPSVDGYQVLPSPSSIFEIQALVFIFYKSFIEIQFMYHKIHHF